MKTIFSIAIWMYWAVCIIVFFIIVLLLYIITAPFDSYNKMPNQVLSGLGWLMMKVNPGWSFDINGDEPQKVSQPTIVVANHQSFLDMPLMYLLPWNMKWVAKSSLFKIPILGWLIYLTGHIAIDRRSMRSFKKMDTLVEPIEQGIPGMIFPEGTRTENGEIQSLKNGAFKLAKRYDFNILPVVIDGSYQAMPSGSWQINPKQDFEISVLDPIKVSEFNSAGEIKERVSVLFNRELSAMRSKTMT
ncbi:1-acyl-sn-glycerol-3-phosphate acyltransferase [Fodinibius salinus]|uniref:1-acyl-sn-glycerol-3-phosphate acyltransferase n=1 Tax=Fodinibius salinus TaxID=860790 RepID=A0A5D3YQ87_9BACT|nr:lysophospholipid acyltransferase family protein [Fodinibius salinus]TYP95438.1 1-acyl-sn-glycerol-3-phosphate acyltransferase [Fodinibius salinus]